MADNELRVTALHRSLNEEKTMGGGEKGLVVINTTAALCICFASNTLYWVAVAIVVHFFLVWIHKLDPKMRKIYIKYSRQHARYDPWPHAVITDNARPEGFDQGNLC
jgi:type IV secretory pathway TrbD component